MRKLASLLAVLMLFNALAFAQQKTVTGTVRDAKGEPIPFATVLETGTNNAATADANGSFSIRIKEGSSLTISAVGFEETTVKPGTGITTITLEQKGDELKEVVVSTAFGIKKSARVTPYSAQVIDAEKMKLIPQTNLNNALAGKVAGTQFRGQSPIKLSSQGSFRIRGGQGLGDVDPIYVVDGTIVNGFDINPDDVADVTVLKGANATALFGGRARNGAIVINTKKAAIGTSSIEVNQGITLDKVYVLPRYQNIYAGGSLRQLKQFTWNASMPAEWQALDGKFFQDYTDDASWGPRMVGQEYVPWYAWIPGHSRYGQTAALVPQKDNMRDFWETGITNTTNVAFSKSGTGYNTRLSYTNNSVKGLLPNSSMTRHTITGSLNLDLNERFTAGTNFTFTNQKIQGSFDDGYANQSAGGMNQWFHRNLDMNIMKELRGLRTPLGTMATWNFRTNPDAGNPNTVYKANYWYNFYTWFDQIDNRQRRDRLFGDAFLVYKLNKNIRLKGTVRKNQLTTTYENITPSMLEASALQTGVLAGYSTGGTRYNEMNYEFLASYNQKVLEKLDISANAGANWMHTDYRSQTMNTVNGLNVPDLYAISNSKANPSIGNSRETERQRSLFANGEFEWDRFLSLSWAVRSDWYSTLFKGENNLISPAFGASFVFSEFTKTDLPWLSFGKVFGSWGRKPTALGIYDNNFLYGVNQNQWNGNFLMGTPNTLVDPSTVGALITTFEAGLDLKFLRNRLGVNIVYYDEVNDKGPLSVPIGPVSGFTSRIVNAARVERRGIEVIVDARPISRKDFTWDITKTFSYLIDNPVVEIFGDQDEILLSGGAFGTRFARAFQKKGQDWGQLIGGGIARNAAGVPLLDANGFYVRDQFKEWGSVVPKVTGGLVNTLSYKNIMLNFTIDYQFGGKFFSLSESWGHYSGLMEATAAVNDKGMNIRDAIADGGGVHVVGVAAADGQTVVDMYVDAQDYWHQFYNNQIAEPFIHDLSYVKLREISLGYQIPVQKLGIGKTFKAAALSVVARNPWIIYRDAKNFDPSEISGVQGEDGQFPGTRSLGINLKLNF